jgi:hypothetical protein
MGYTTAGGWLAIAGSVIHLSLSTTTRMGVWEEIVAAGWWSTITMKGTADQLQRAEAFWFSPGSFAVPLLILGILAVWSGRSGQRVPGILGWMLVVWGVLLASLMPISGAWAIMTVGILFVAGDRARERGTAAIRADASAL